MNVILFETIRQHKQLLPLTFTRPVAVLRVGIITIKEKWEQHLKQPVSCLTQPYLQQLFPVNFQGDNLFVNAALLPSLIHVELVQNLKPEQALVKGEDVLAFRSSGNHFTSENIELLAKQLKTLQFEGETILIKNVWDIFKQNEYAISSDFDLLTYGRKTAPLSNSNKVIGNPQKLFIEEGATVEGSILNTNTGVIYIGKDAEVMEGALVRGPFALGEHATLKMGAKIYGATTVGPYCKVGGEVNNSIFFAYSNKGHDGFIGNSVIGEWCNLGADTNNSNLKNNYGDVDLWSYNEEKSKNTGLQFCGLVMGDHSKAGINTMFNTGTVVGVSANIFGGDFPPKFIPSFSWGGAQWLRTFTFDKGLEVAKKMMERRGIKLSENDIAVLKHVYEYDSKYRKQ